MVFFFVICLLEVPPHGSTKLSFWWRAQAAETHLQRLRRLRDLIVCTVNLCFTARWIIIIIIIVIILQLCGPLLTKMISGGRNQAQQETLLVGFVFRFSSTTSLLPVSWYVISPITTPSAVNHREYMGASMHKCKIPCFYTAFIHREWLQRLFTTHFSPVSISCIMFSSLSESIILAKYKRPHNLMSAR